MGNSLRDEVKDVIRGHLAEYYHTSELAIDADLVADIADGIFDVLQIPEAVQDRDLEKDKCPKCGSNNIYYPEKGSANDDVLECGSCHKLFEQEGASHEKNRTDR